MDQYTNVFNSFFANSNAENQEKMMGEEEATENKFKHELVQIDRLEAHEKLFREFLDAEEETRGGDPYVNERYPYGDLELKAIYWLFEKKRSMDETKIVTADTYRHYRLTTLPSGVCSRMRDDREYSMSNEADVQILSDMFARMLFTAAYTASVAPGEATALKYINSKKFTDLHGVHDFTKNQHLWTRGYMSSTPDMIGFHPDYGLVPVEVKYSAKIKQYRSSIQCSGRKQLCHHMAVLGAKRGFLILVGKDQEGNECVLPTDVIGVNLIDYSSCEIQSREAACFKFFQLVLRTIARAGADSIRHFPKKVARQSRMFYSCPLFFKGMIESNDGNIGELCMRILAVSKESAEIFKSQLTSCRKRMMMEAKGCQQLWDGNPDGLTDDIKEYKEVHGVWVIYSHIA